METKQILELPENPFLTIGMTLSGGGFRASAYGLGCLSYLNHVSLGEKKLIEHVDFIGSTSGGTLPAILFSAFNAKGKSFKACYDHLRNQVLHGSFLIEGVCKILADDNKWKKDYPTKKRNLINAFAIAYNDIVFDNMKFGTFWESKANSTLKEVCFNSSEMVNGRTFRFEADGGNKLYIGNRYLRAKIPDEECFKNIRLGDIMAASSCFPGGFEPIIFPDDFAIDSSHQNQMSGNIIQAEDYDSDKYIPFPFAFSLLDGGITDNQAVESLKLADKRRNECKGNGFDLMLICDVANYFIEGLPPIVEKKEWWNKSSFQSIINIHKYSPIFLLVSFLLPVLLYGCDDLYLEGCFKSVLTAVWVVLSVSGIMTGIYWFGRLRLKGVLSTFKKTIGKNTWNKGAKGIIDFILKRPMYETINMIQKRLTSVMRVALDIQSLQIRRLNYDFMFQKPAWYLRVRAVNIYELSSSNKAVFGRIMKKLLIGKMPNQFCLTEQQMEILKPSKCMESIAEKARSMGTTLWFTDKDVKENMRDSIIATGQFTICYNLLNYCYQLKNKKHSFIETNEFGTLLSSLESDWEKFLDNPLWMV